MHACQYVVFSLLFHILQIKRLMCKGWETRGPPDVGGLQLYHLLPLAMMTKADGSCSPTGKGKGPLDGKVQSNSTVGCGTHFRFQIK